MNLNALVTEFGLAVKAASASLDREVTGGYASDLLSDVLAHAGVTLSSYEAGEG